MAKQFLKPALMVAVLTHDQDYQRAVGLLNEDWNPDDQPIYRDVFEARDVIFARQLQQSGLVPGKVDLGDYQSANHLLVRHPQWFSAGSRQALLAPFTD
ncbi:hypothetical protein KZE55_09380 [Limosilactobacillus panis]|uniref:hypothetical protein n=1 Tax=Limosilactobacillus panis TaxID=47493 RepID=UPI001C975451|nr:hypothetical protein [Limosilactobacillus panis]QZN92943.1 hypothetical protein KZE55_09380 [Limosilactobacillus panis]